MSQPPLTFYRTLNRFFFPRSYAMKFLGVAFLGIQAPVIAFAIYLAMTAGWESAMPSLGVVLGATLVGMTFTLWSQHHLLAPVQIACHELRAYRMSRRLPVPPGDYQDTAGQLMREARRSIESLDGLTRLKDNLALGIAHDFRSPLIAIIAAAEMLEMKHPENTSTHKLAQLIRRSAQAQSYQVAGLLDAGMSDTSNTFNYTAVKLTKLWQAAFDSQALFAQTEGVALNFLAVDSTVAGDQARLVQIMNNLIGNAIKACDSGGMVEIGVEPCQRGRRISVSDNGPGIDPQKLYSALAGSAANNTSTDDQPKLGLGLRMVTNLLRLHASKLNIERRPEGGMRFWFDLATDPASTASTIPMPNATD